MTARATSLGRVAVFMSVAAAGWLLFTDLHRFQLSDSLLPALISLQAWTPFFWGQERLGMLGPLLALPFRDPMTNLLLQSGLFALAGFGVANLLARVMTSSSTSWTSAGAIVALALLLGLAEQDQFRWFLLHHEYSLGLSVGLLGVLAWPSGQTLNSDGVGVRATVGRRVVAALLLLVAQWVNVSLVVPLSVLVLVRQMVAARGTAWSRHEARHLLFVVVMCFGENLLFARSQDPARYSLLPVGEWPMAIGSLASNAVAGGWATLAIVASVAAVAVVIWWAHGGPREVAVDAIPARHAARAPRPRQRLRPDHGRRPDHEVPRRARTQGLPRRLPRSPLRLAAGRPRRHLPLRHLESRAPPRGRRRHPAPRLPALTVNDRRKSVAPAGPAGGVWASSQHSSVSSNTLY